MTAEQVVLAVTRALAQLGIPHMTVGAIAGIYYGIGRTTDDADFLIAVDDLQLSPLRKALGTDFSVDPQPRIETVTMGTYYVVKHAESDFAIDLFILRDDPHDTQAFTRRRMVEFEGGQAPLCSAEDYIITKLRWAKTKQREKDTSDVRAVLAVQHGKLDYELIRKWCDQHETRQLFERILATLPVIPD